MTTMLGPQSLGSDGDYQLGPIEDSVGNPVAFSDSDSLEATIWKSTGVRDEALASPTVTWDTSSGGGAAGRILLSVAAADLAGLAPGDYGIEVVVIPGDARPRSVLWATLRLVDSPRAAAPAWPSVAALEEWLIRQHRETLDLAGMDAATSDGRNRDLGPPIATALRAVGLRPTSPLRVADADLGQVTPLLEPAFLLACRIETLEAALGRLHARVDLAIGGGAGNTYSLSQAAQSLSQAITRLRAQYTSWYETGSSRTELAAIDSRYHWAGADLLGFPYRR